MVHLRARQVVVPFRSSPTRSPIPQHHRQISRTYLAIPVEIRRMPDIRSPCTQQESQINRANHAILIHSPTIIQDDQHDAEKAHRRWSCWR